MPIKYSFADGATRHLKHTFSVESGDRFKIAIYYYYSFVYVRKQHKKQVEYE